MNSFSNQDIKIASHLGSLNTKSFRSIVHSIYQMSNAVEVAHYGNQIYNKIKLYFMIATCDAHLIILGDFLSCKLKSIYLGTTASIC